MTIDEVAPLLYGPQWQTPLAHALGVDLRTVQYWAAGIRPMPQKRWQAIHALLRERQRELAQTIDALDG